MTSRLALYGAGLAFFMAAATLLAAPYRPNLVPLPADWPHLPRIEYSIFPSGAVYTGDRAGLSASSESDPAGGKLQVRLDTTGGSPLAEMQFFLGGSSESWSAKIPWMTDASLQAGWHTLFLYLAADPAAGGAAVPAIPYPLRVLPEAQRPELRRDARWEQAESACCVYFFLSGTESERDIGNLIARTESIYPELVGRMGGASPKLTLLFLPRIYGQGGLASQEGIISYADRNPTGTDFSVVLKHEMVHLIAGARSGEGPRAPLILQEGWAVYLTGGHYQFYEALPSRAAALIRLGSYTPLAELADSFYASQHEAAYIEAGAFVEYLAGRFGEEEALAMFFDPAAADSPAEWLDRMLVKHFRLSLDDCERDWLDSLRALPPDLETERDVEFTLAMLDAFRVYERLYAPGSGMYDLWLPDTARARSEQITADYLPSPATKEMITLELLLLAARQAAWKGDWARAWDLLDAVERTLEAKQRRVPDPVTADPAAETYRALVSAVLRTGREPLRVDLQGDLAVVETRDPKTLAKEEQHWRMIRGSWSRGG
jgi:hypothetical protein